jgi:NAD(P)H-hydrate repair Nnr-like enzyme with NAD(P)H-hydrate dehydratase domain
MATERAITIPLVIAVPEALVIALPRRGSAPQLRPHASAADAILVGPGIAEDKRIVSLVRGLVGAMKPDATLVLDVDALSAAGSSKRTVITPHAAERFDCVVTLKGAFDIHRDAG